MAACFLLPFFSYKHRISVGDSRACRTCFPSTCQTLVETRQQTPPRPWPQQRRETGAAAADSQRAAREAAWGEMRRVQSGHGSPCMAGRAGRSVSRHLKEGAGAMAVGEGVSQAEGEPVPAPEERLCWKSSGTRRKPGWLGTRVGKSSRRQGSEGTGTQMVGLGGRREAGPWLGEERWQTPAASIRRVT